jgi:hypothetical protein
MHIIGLTPEYLINLLQIVLISNTGNRSFKYLKLEKTWQIYLVLKNRNLKPAHLACKICKIKRKEPYY